jgi:predicted nucleotidyltransferase component of viral defense system
MQALTEKTNKIFEAISILNCIKGYFLIGGSAISLQIHKRFSEDLDFCKWSSDLKKDKPIVDWPVIEKELKTIGNITSRDVLGFDQVNFIVNDVKMTFFAKQENLSPVKNAVPLVNNIQAADLVSLGIMKVEVMLRRSLWRDYYDIYSLLKEGISLKDMIDGASLYSNRKLKTKNALNFLSNSNNYKKEKDFHLLNPSYDIDAITIETLIMSEIKKYYSIDNKYVEQINLKNKNIRL